MPQKKMKSENIVVTIPVGHQVVFNDYPTNDAVTTENIQRFLVVGVPSLKENAGTSSCKMIPEERKRCLRNICGSFQT